jgi:hypothetical protein
MSSTREVAQQIAEEWLDHFTSDHRKQELIDRIPTTLQHREQDVRERCAQIAGTPYGDDVRAMAGDEPRAVGQKIADAIRRDSEQEGEQPK